jgi:hypothetical protein
MVGVGSLDEATEAPIQQLTSANSVEVEQAAQEVIMRFDHFDKNFLMFGRDSRNSLQQVLKQIPYQQETWESHATAWLVASAIHAQGREQLQRLIIANNDRQQIENLGNDLAELNSLLKAYRQQLEPPAEFTPSEQFATLTQAAEKLAATLQRLSSRP